MRLVGELKEKVEKAQDLEEAKKAIEEAGMQLTDDEMDHVAGGSMSYRLVRQKKQQYEARQQHTINHAVSE